MRVDRDDRYITEQPSKDAKPSLTLPSFLQDFPRKKLIILGLAIVIILLLLSLIIFRSSSRKNEPTLVTPPEVNSVSSADANTTPVTDGLNSPATNAMPTESAGVANQTPTESALNQTNTQQQLDIPSDTGSDLANTYTPTAPSVNRDITTSTNRTTTINDINGRTHVSHQTDSHNRKSTNRKDEKTNTAKNAKIGNDRYTIQLSASKSAEGLRKLVKQNNITDYHIYETKHKNGTWFILIKGNYSSRDEAHKAMKSLPAALQKDKPWVKSGAAINKEKIANN